MELTFVNIFFTLIVKNIKYLIRHHYTAIQKKTGAAAPVFAFARTMSHYVRNSTIYK